MSNKIVNNLQNADLQYVKKFHRLINKSKLARECGVSGMLIGYILTGERTDHYGAIAKAKAMIEQQLNAIEV